MLAAVLLAAGCRSIPSEPASPFVRVAQIDGKFWFTQNGTNFLSLGINVVQPRDWSTPADGRVYKSPYADDLPAWASNTTERMLGWGFGTVAGWSHGYINEHSPLRYTLVVPFGNWRENDSRLIDVFDPVYSNEVDQVAKENCAPHRDDTRLIGYFLNNELPWYGQYGWPSDPKISLLSRYRALPESAPGRKRLEEFIAKNGSDRLAEVNWAGVVADQFYKLCAAAARRHDPNHLVLGSRIAGRAQVPVMAAAGRYCDVVSMNQYSKTGVLDTNLLGQVAALTGKPILITEFSWRATENRSDCHNSRGADVTVQTQQDRADCFNRYAGVALAQPYIVGYDWFLYHDQPPGGRFDGEDCNYGLVDIYDKPYEEIVNAVSNMNARAAAIHAASPVQVPPYEPALIADIRLAVVRGLDRPLGSEVEFADGEADWTPFGDLASGAKVEKRGGRITSVVNGWGCGVVAGANRMKARADGSSDLLGATQLVVRLRADADVEFAPSLNESGFGPIDSQVFDGAAGSDGEAYGHVPVAAGEGWHEYCFNLREFERNAYYGNQRGNNVLDMQAIAQVSISFTRPVGQERSAEIGWIRFR